MSTNPTIAFLTVPFIISHYILKLLNILFLNNFTYYRLVLVTLEAEVFEKLGISGILKNGFPL
jgi:hypothetical protein